MSEDALVSRLQELAAQATTETERLHYQMMAALRPGVNQFIREHVLVHGGPTVSELPDIWVSVLASLASEMIEMYMANTGEHRPARRAMMTRFMKERFAHHVDDNAKRRILTFGEMRRADA